MRRAEPADAAAIAVVHTVGWRTGYAGLLPQPYLDGLSLADSQRRWETQLRDDDRTTVELAAEVGPDSCPTVVGIAVVGPSIDPDAPSDGRVGELFVLYVLPQYWGTGVGYRLHERAVEVLRDGGHGEATLWVLHDNLRALSFYRRQGWRDDGLTKIDEQDEVALTERRMRLALGRERSA